MKIKRLKQAQLEECSGTGTDSLTIKDDSTRQSDRQTLVRRSRDSVSQAPRKSRFALFAPSAFALLAVGAWAGLPDLITPKTVDQGQYVTEEVRSGDFRITITERGQLDSLKNASVINQVSGSRTILWIIPEGTRVEEGEVICRLDSSSLEDNLVGQRISVTSAKAKLTQSAEAIEIQKRQNESDLAAAQLAMELADLDLKKFQEGEYRRDHSKLQGEVDLAREELNQAEEAYLFAKRLAKKGYKSQNEVETARIAVDRAKNKLEAAEADLRVLEEFTYQRTLKELEEMVRETKRELERVQRQGQAALAQLQAEYEANRLTYDVELAELKEEEEEVAACTIRAPQAGEVVYATPRRRRSDSGEIEEGATVRERQTLINLPDLTQMKVDARIHESKISQLVEHKDQKLPVLVYVDAFPNEVYRGVLDSVSSVPMAGSWPNYDLKEYEAVIRISESESRLRKLRPGLTASVEIIIKERKNVRQVPVQAVLPIGDRYYSYVLTPKQPERRTVKIGEANDEFIEVLDGLEIGERVILNARSHFADELAELEAAAKSDGDSESDGSDSSAETDAIQQT